MFTVIKSKSRADCTKEQYMNESRKFVKWLKDHEVGKVFVDADNKLNLGELPGKLIQDYISSRCLKSDGKFKTSSTPSGIRNALK